MNAVVVEVNIEPGREDEGVAYLHANVLPAMKQTPGFVSGYWLASKEGQGLTVLVFDDAEAAQAMAGGLADAPKADFATLGKIEVRDVVAQVDRSQWRLTRGGRQPTRPRPPTSGSAPRNLLCRRWIWSTRGWGARLT